MKTSKPKPPPEPEPEEIPGEDEPFEPTVGGDTGAEDRMLVDCLLGVIGQGCAAAARHPCGRIAIQNMVTAAAERIGRICGADLADPSEIT